MSWSSNVSVDSSLLRRPNLLAETHKTGTVQKYEGWEKKAASVHGHSCLVFTNTSENYTTLKFKFTLTKMHDIPGGNDLTLTLEPKEEYFLVLYPERSDGSGSSYKMSMSWKAAS